MLSKNATESERDKYRLAWGYLQILNYYKAQWIWRLPKEKKKVKKLAKEMFDTILQIDGISEKGLHPVKTCYDITGRKAYMPYRSALKRARNP